MTLKWEEPPPSLGSTGLDHQGIANALRGRPKEWAVIAELGPGKGPKASEIASNIKYGRISMYRPAGSFEAKGLKGKVYARYVGEGAS